MSLGDIQELLPLEIEGIETCYTGLGAGYSTLGLGSKVVDSNPPYWEFTEPICRVMVPTDEERYKIGNVLSTLPTGAKTVEAVYGKD